MRRCRAAAPRGSPPPPAPVARPIAARFPPGRRGQGSTGREDRGLPLLQDVAPQVDDAGEQLEVIHTVRLPPFGWLHMDRAAVPRHVHVARDRREHDLACEPVHRGRSPSAAAPSTTRSTAWHLVDHFVELDDSVALEAGEHCPGLGNEPHHLGRRLVGRPARRWALVGARAQPGDYEQPSDLSLSASACRWSRHARSFSRSLATTSAGARATKFWLVSFAASPVSCWSSRLRSLERRRHSCCTSISPSSATNTSLPSASTACAPTLLCVPSKVSSDS